MLVFIFIHARLLLHTVPACWGQTQHFSGIRGGQTGKENILAAIEIFWILIVVVFWIYTTVKTYQTMYSKWIAYYT